MKLGLVLRLYRQASGLGLRAMAEETGISSATLSRLENGKEPDVTTFKRLLDWLMEPPRRRLAASLILVDEESE